MINWFLHHDCKIVSGLVRLAGRFPAIVRYTTGTRASEFYSPLRVIRFCSIVRDKLSSKGKRRLSLGGLLPKEGGASGSLFQILGGGGHF